MPSILAEQRRALTERIMEARLRDLPQPKPKTNSRRAQAYMSPQRLFDVQIPPGMSLVDRVMWVVAHHLQIPPEIVKNTAHTTAGVYARRLCYLYLYDCTMATPNRIGAVSSRDRSTVMNALLQAKRIVHARNDAFISSYAEIRRCMMPHADCYYWGA